MRNRIEDAGHKSGIPSPTDVETGSMPGVLFVSFIN